MLPFRAIYEVSLRMQREWAGLAVSPAAAVVDSQTSAAAAARAKGDRAHEKIVDRKRHMTVHTARSLRGAGHLACRRVADTEPAVGGLLGHLSSSGWIRPGRFQPRCSRVSPWSMGRSDAPAQSAS